MDKRPRTRWIKTANQKPTHFRIWFKDMDGRVYQGNYSRISDTYYAYNVMDPIPTETVTHWKLQTERS